MTSNNQQSHQPEQQSENEIKHNFSRGQRPDFITSPIDSDRKNALLDRELRSFLRRTENFNKLVKAGILLSDGRVVCSDEQWNETRGIVLRQIEENQASKSSSELTEKPIQRKSVPEKIVSRGNEISSPTRGVGRNLKSTSNFGLENTEETASESGDELWGNMPTSSSPGTSKEKPARRGSAYSRDSISRQSTGRAAGKASSIGYMKDERTSESRRKLREQDTINKQRIMEQARRDEQKRESAQEKQRESVQGKSSRKRLNSSHSDNLADRINKADMRVLKTLQQSRDKLKMVENSGRGTMVDSPSSSSYSLTSFESPDRLYTDLLKRQDRLFRSLGQRNIDEIPALIEAVPPSLDRQYEEIYKEYGPHIELQRLLSNLICSKITTDVFYREASGVVKMMHPGRIIEYFGKYLASLNRPTKLLKLTSTNSTHDDRYALTWDCEPPTRDKALSIGTRLIDDILEHARSVHTYLTEGSGVNLSMLGIGRPDPMAVAQKRIQVGDLIIESHTDDHVTFSDRNVICPRPLEEGLSVSELKPVVDRPPTPIPEEERIRRKSREKIARKTMDAKAKARELLDLVREEADKRLKRKMKQERTKEDKQLPLKRDPSLPVSSGLLHERVQAKLREWKLLQRSKSVQKVHKTESLSDLVPDLNGTQRAKYVRHVSKQVANIVGQTIQQAQSIILDAMNMQAESENAQEEDSDEFESVSSVVAGDLGARKSQEYENLLEEFQLAEDPRLFAPVFGSKEMQLDQGVLACGLAAISVRHGTDDASHDEHDHVPLVSHMKEFFTARGSMPAISAISGVRKLDGKKRHSMPAILPDCMDPSKVHDRNSFMSLVRPDVKTLPEYRNMTLSQVERVMRDHSIFGQIQELSPGESDDEINSEDLGQADEEIMPKFQRENLEPAPPPDDEARDSVSALPSIDDQDQTPRTVASMPIPPRATDSDNSWDGAASPPPKTQSLTQSRMVLRCDSDPRLSLRSSKAEVQVDIHEHSKLCQHHESHNEDEEELQKLESSAFGISSERTSSATKVKFSDDEGNTSMRRSGSADDVTAHHTDADSDDEAELRVSEPVQDGNEPPQPERRLRYH